MNLIDIEAEGMKEAMALLKVLNKIGASIKAVELHGKRRIEGSDNDNADVLDYLSKGGRDFISSDDAMAADAGRAFMREARKRIGQHGGIKGVKGLANAEKVAREITMVGFYAAMDEVKRHIRTRIDTGKTADGGSPDDLSKAYATYKQNKHGFTKPIGKATGQVYDNLAPGKRNVKFKKN